MDGRKGVIGLAAGAAVLLGSSSFVPSPAPVESPAAATLQGLRAPQAAAAGPCIGGLTAAACGIVAAAGLASHASRRSVECRGARLTPYKPRQPGGRNNGGLTDLPVAWYPQMSGMIPVENLYRIMPTSEKTLATMVGADVELGETPWDPLGFGKLFDRNFDFNRIMTYPHVQWLREAEVKHGRICMLAFVGMVVQQFYQWPDYPQEPDWLKALDACYAEKLPALGLAQISAFAMIVEGRYYPGEAWVGLLDREPGDLGFDPCKLSKKPGFNLKEKQLSELKNGRLAMIGVASMAANHVIPGSVPLLEGAL
eukprot:TRINITY_DN16661_c0_g1_i1.p1 TRINITY_DN16661_c0_g1~~TRINITY_DN16661_c0_g1_i1.p1  ORF type:complete len:311 (-),score=60.90 TRINITY_DN16661_c0_g1_i1:90-1022(-)